jgi:DNA-binding SARP family transcriptional activator
MFSLKLFGVVSLAGDNGPLTGPATQRRRLALLALIAAGPEAGTGRDRIASLLWPDTDSDQARRYLADSLYALRRALGPQ